MGTFTRTELIEACFALYILLLLMFAYVYFRLYQNQPSRFLFGANLVPAQQESVRSRTLRLVAGLTALREVLPDLEERVAAGIWPESLASEGLELAASSGAVVKLVNYRHAGPVSGYDAAYVEVFAPDGSKLHSEILAEMFPPWRRRLTALLKQRESVQRRLAKARALEAALASGNAKIWSFWDFVYFSGISQTTVGFGDILPNSTAVRLIVITQILAGYAILVVLLNVILLGA